MSNLSGKAINSIMVLDSGAISGTGTGAIQNISNFVLNSDLGEGFIKVRIWLKVAVAGVQELSLAVSTVTETLKIQSPSNDTANYYEFFLYKSKVTPTKSNGISTGYAVGSTANFTTQAIYDSATFDLSTTETIYINCKIVGTVAFVGSWIAELHQEI